MSVKYCPRCGKQLPADANFCLFCGAPVAAWLMQTKSGLVTAGGILIIIAACISALDGLSSLASSALFFSLGYSVGMSGFYTIVFVASSLAVIGFAFGLAAGIQALRGKQFAVVVVGAVLLMIAGFANFLTSLVPYGGILGAIAYGTPVIILDLLGLIFVASRRQEFLTASPPTRSMLIP